MLKVAAFSGDLILELEPNEASLGERMALIRHARDYIHTVLGWDKDA
jgi:hypothetical protein